VERANGLLDTKPLLNYNTIPTLDTGLCTMQVIGRLRIVMAEVSTPWAFLDPYAT